MRLIRSTIRDGKRGAGNLKRNPWQLSAILLLVALLASTATTAERTIRYRLAPVNDLAGASATATGYLAKLIAERTDRRIAIDIISRAAPILTAHRSEPDELQMLVKDINGATEADRLLKPPNYRLLGQAENGYQVWIVAEAWQQLTDELKIIVQGAVKDSVAYCSELNRKNTSGR